MDNNQLMPSFVVCVKSYDGFTPGRIYRWPCPVDDNGTLQISITNWQTSLWNEYFQPVPTESFLAAQQNPQKYLKVEEVTPDWVALVAKNLAKEIDIEIVKELQEEAQKEDQSDYSDLSYRTTALDFANKLNISYTSSAYLINAARNIEKYLREG